MNARVLVILTIVVFLFSYLAAPVLALKGLADGLVAGDAESLNQHVDFAAIRSSAKEQMSAMMIADPKMSSNPFAVALGPMVLNAVVDNWLTPSGLAALIAKGKAEVPKDAKSQIKVDPKKIDFPRLIQAVSIRGPFEFRLIPPNESGQKPPEFVFRNLGVYNWKLSDIRMPLSALPAKPSQ